jgi:CPA1 family monovalent cation:H+ antiporter
MNLLNIIALLLTLSAVFNYLNYRYISLPTTIGIMAIALSISLCLIVLGKLNIIDLAYFSHFIDEIDFNEALMQGMLSFLLFASAIHINLADLARQKWTILLLASAGVLLTTVIVGFGTWYISGVIGHHLSLIYCLLFGAIIAPTDPIAVIGILKSAEIPRSLESKVSGESLFNDGFAVVVFIAILGIATGHSEATAGHIALLFLEEAVGGIIFGVILGYVGNRMLSTIDNYQLEIMITLAMVMGGYSLASAIHISGPLAMVVAGLIIGNHGRTFAMSDKTQQHLDDSWHLIDEVLNAVLFLLIGLEVLVIEINPGYLFLGAVMIPLTLMARFIAVSSIIRIMSLKRSFSDNVIKILTWGGLRGGISVALALSLPRGLQKEEILTMTYVVVVFSILVQGLTIGRLIQHLKRRTELV